MAVYSPVRTGSGGVGAGGDAGIPTTPNGTATVHKKSGFNRYGQANYTTSGSYRIYIVTLSAEEKLSSIRTDTSASKSTIDETLYDTRVQISPSSRVEVGDGMTIESNSIIRQYRVAKVTDVYSSNDISHLLVFLTRL